MENGTYLIEGKRAVLDALKHNVSFNLLLIEEGLRLDVLPECEVIEVSRKVIEALSDTQSPEGIIAEAFIPDMSFDVNKLNGFLIYLDRLQDAGNLGTVIRTADAAGAGAVILSPECVEVFNPKTVRATMSSVFNVPIMIANDSVSAIEAIKNAGYTVYAAALGGEDFYSLDKIESAKSCIIIGNEGNGICDEVLAVADKKISLPMRGGAESLNAAICAGILTYGFIFGR